MLTSWICWFSILGLDFRILDFGCWMLDVGCLDVGLVICKCFWIVDVGFLWKVDLVDTFSACWSSFGLVLAFFWYSFGVLLVFFWFHLGLTWNNYLSAELISSTAKYNTHISYWPSWFPSTADCLRLGFFESPLGCWLGVDLGLADWLMYLGLGLYVCMYVLGVW